ncbi:MULTISPECIES: hypothetical protein [Chitinophagaceae]
MQKQWMLLTFLVLGSVTFASAQLQPKSTYPYRLFPKKETFPKPIPHYEAPKTYHYTIPPKQNATVNNHIIALKNPLIYSHNNKQGFDVYKSEIDGMAVLVPDKENRASLGMKVDANNALPYKETPSFK